MQVGSALAYIRFRFMAKCEITKMLRPDIAEIIRPAGIQPRDQTNEKKKRRERLAGTTVDLLMGRATSRFVPLPHTCEDNSSSCLR